MGRSCRGALRAQTHSRRVSRRRGRDAELTARCVDITAQNANIPGFQTFLNYALLTVTYGFFSVYKLGPRGYAKVLLTQGWKFAILSLFDVVGNYLVVQAYAYSNLLSCQLLDGWATVVCVILSFLFLKVRYHWTQVLGVVLCIGGLALLTVSDLLTGKNYQARDRLKGDLFMLAGASCYGVSNVLEEFLVTKQPIYVVVGQMWVLRISESANVQGLVGRAHQWHYLHHL